MNSMITLNVLYLLIPLLFFSHCSKKTNQSNPSQKINPQKSQKISHQSSFNPKTGEFIPDTHTVALWHFNEGKEKFVFDSTPYENDGLILECDWTKGIFQYAVDLNGSCHIEIDSSNYLNLNQLITVEGWFYFRQKQPLLPVLLQKQTAQKMAGKPSYSLWFNNNPDFHRITSFTVLWRTNLTDGIEYETNSNTQWKNLVGSWNYIAATYDGKINKIYINGKLTGSLKTQGTLKQSHEFPLLIGVDSSQFNFFNGIVDEIRISNVVRSESAIQNYWLNAQKINSQNP